MPQSKRKLTTDKLRRVKLTQIESCVGDLPSMMADVQAAIPQAPIVQLLYRRLWAIRGIITPGEKCPLGDPS